MNHVHVSKPAAPTGSACGIVLYYMRAPVFPRVCDYRIHLVVRAIPLTLKLLEFLRCDVPVSSTLALVNTSVCQSVIYSISKYMCTVSKSASQSVSQPISQLVNQQVHVSTSASQSVSQPFSQLVNQQVQVQISQLVNQQVHDWSKSAITK